MKKLLVSILLAFALAACSSNKAPELETCQDARDLVKKNHHKIRKAFANNDANTIGKLELQNRDIIRENMECFPKAEEYKKHWERMHGDM